MKEKLLSSILFPEIVWRHPWARRAQTRPMNNLVLPNRVVIQLVDKNLLPLKMAGVLFRVQLFARHKNDFTLQPFASDGEGIVAIVKQAMEAEVAANYDSGVMDYAHVSDCRPSVEIRLLSEDDIDRAVEARKIWNQLLTGERDRWNSMDQLLNVYRSANNRKLLADQSHSIRDHWDKAGAEYSYSCVVVPR